MPNKRIRKKWEKRLGCPLPPTLAQARERLRNLRPLQVEGHPMEAVFRDMLPGGKITDFEAPPGGWPKSEADVAQELDALEDESADALRGLYEDLTAMEEQSFDILQQRASDYYKE